jgi:hypothetical protein
MSSGLTEVCIRTFVVAEWAQDRVFGVRCGCVTGGEGRAGL